jgi:hypothetical protein
VYGIAGDRAAGLRQRAGHEHAHVGGDVSRRGRAISRLCSHGAPHPTGGVLVGNCTVPANPLKAGGAKLPLIMFSSDHSEADHTTGAVGDAGAAAAVISPSTNAPQLGKANTVAVWLASEEGRVRHAQPAARALQPRLLHSARVRNGAGWRRPRIGGRVLVAGPAGWIRIVVMVDPSPLELARCLSPRS